MRPLTEPAGLEPGALILHYRTNISFRTGWGLLHKDFLAEHLLEALVP